MQLIHRGIALDREDRRTIWRIVLPSLVELVFTQLFAMVDTIMLGQTDISAVAIAAVGLTNNPVNLVNGVLTALHIGTTAAVAWAVGAGNENAARSITRTALTLSLILGTFASAVLYFPAGQLVTFMGAQEDTYLYAKEYLEIVALGMLPAMVGFACTASLRGIGLTRLPMAYNLAGNLFNVIGNYALIYGRLGMPELGVAGAAISTTISRYVACTLALLVLFRGHSKLRLHIREDFRLRKEWLKRIFGVGVTSGLEQLIMQIGFIMFARTVSGLGTVIFAAHQIGMQFLNLSFTFGDGIGVAGTSLVGQMLGRKRPDLAQMYGNIAQRIAMTTAIVLALLILSFRYPLVSLFVSQQSVVNATASIMLILALFQPFQTSSVVMSGALRGAGDTKYVAKVMLVCVTGIRPVLSFLAVYVITHFFTPLVSELPSTALSSLTIFDHWTNQIPIVALMGAWCASLVDMIVRMSCVLRRFNSGKWHNIQV